MSLQTAVGTPCARGRTKECGNSGWGAVQSQTLTHLESSRSQPKQCSGKKSSIALRQGQAATLLRTVKFQLPDSDSQQSLFPALTSLPMLSFHCNKGLWILSGTPDLYPSSTKQFSLSISQCLFPHRCEFKSALCLGNYPATTFFSIPPKKRVPV